MILVEPDGLSIRGADPLFLVTLGTAAQEPFACGVAAQGIGLSANQKDRQCEAADHRCGRACNDHGPERRMGAR